MMKLRKLTMLVGALCVPALAIADLYYNPEHDEAIKNLHAIESATVNLQYQCGEYSLIISAYAAQSNAVDRRANVTGKIMSKSASHDVSDQLRGLITRDNILTSEMNVRCNADKGAFRIDFTPNEFDQSRFYRTVVEVFADGIVEGGSSVKPKSGYGQKLR